MDDSQIFGKIVVGHAQEAGGNSRQFGIVVADHQSDGDGELGEKFRQSGFKFRRDASGSVKHVTCEHQLQRMVFVNKQGEYVFAKRVSGITPQRFFKRAVDSQGNAALLAVDQAAAKIVERAIQRTL